MCKCLRDESNSPGCLARCLWTVLHFGSREEKIEQIRFLKQDPYTQCHQHFSSNDTHRELPKDIEGSENIDIRVISIL